MQLLKYSFGVGDRFAQQASAQLRALSQLADDGVLVVPVWNKSNREHSFIGSEPASVKRAAAAAVTAAGWKHPWHVDADHIRLETVDRFLDSSDFFTIDVADSIGQPADSAAIDAWIDRHPELIGRVEIAGIATPFSTTAAQVRGIIGHYLQAIREAGAIYRHILERKGAGLFIAEVSMDETDSPQTPLQLLVILAGLADEGVQLQTIAPKFTGRFNKGVDYVGDLVQFEREFRDDIAVLASAAERYGLPANLKLSVHSGSDKFSLYPIIREALADTGAGVHLKTAGTTWLEEVIGLAEAGGDALALVKELYGEALDHVDELCRPYAAVIDIQPIQLPSRAEVANWSGRRMASAIRHVPNHPDFNPSLRQLLHVGFKLAAKRGDQYLNLVRQNEEIVGQQVTTNLYERHLRPLFLPS